jgi:hypothetical protein
MGTTQSVSIQNLKFKIQNLFVVATNTDGCLVTDTVQIVYNELPIIIPNPQFIGKGNSFTILNLPNNSSVQLYNALGQTISLENDYTPNTSLPFGEGWGGAGIYFYVVTLPNGTILKGKLLILEK